MRSSPRGQPSSWTEVEGLLYFCTRHIIYTERRARALIQSHERKGVAALAPECRPTRVLDDILQQLSGTL